VASYLAVVAPVYRTRLGFYSMFWKLWRGSITFDIVIISSPFISARLLFFLDFFTDDEVPAVGDVPLKDVTVRGTTKITITVPYLNSHPMQPGLGYGNQSYTQRNVPQLTCSQMVPPHYDGDVAPTIQLFIWTRPGPDMRFFCKRDPNELVNVSPPVKRVSFQMKIADFQDVDPIFQSRLEGVTNVKGTWEDMLMQYSPSDTLNIEFLSTDSGPARPFDLIGSLFKFWTGVTHLKLVAPLALEDQYIGAFMSDYNFGAFSTEGPPLFDRAWDGASLINTSDTRVLEVTIPYQCSVPCRPTSLAVTEFGSGYYTAGASDWIQPWIVTSTHSTDIPKIYLAAGKDFTYFYDYPPPPFWFWPSFRVPLTSNDIVSAEPSRDDSESFSLV